MKRVVLLITIHSCNILTHPVKQQLPNYNGLFNNDGIPLQPLGSNYLENEEHKPGCSKDRIVLPVKYHFDNRLSGDIGMDNHINLPAIKQPYKNYKVLVATAPAGLELDEDNKPMSIYIVFNDDNNYQSPMDLPTVYFVKKSLHVDAKVIDPVFLVDSNRTVTGLRSKEVQKFIKFRNKFTNRFFRKSDYSDVLEMLDNMSTASSISDSDIVD